MKIRRLTDTGEWTTRRYLSLLGNVLIWIIVAIDAFYLWPTQLHGSTSMVVVSGRSMEPTYFTGDLVIARKMEPSVGDVIVYAPDGFGGSQIVHRIIGGDAKNGWLMQGDNNPREDPFTPKGTEIKGVVLVHYANFGRVTGLLLNPMVWAFVLLASIVLLVWWSSDTCEDDPDDEEKRSSDGDHEPEAGEEPDLIDRVVEGTEAAISRMVTSGAAVGAAAFAILARPSASPRHAAAQPRYAASVTRRVSAIVAMLGLVAILGPSTASASSLKINAGGNIFTKTYTPCTTATLGVTYFGNASPSGSTTYPKMAITGLGGCEGLKLSYTAYGSAGQTLASGSSVTVLAGTNIVSPGGTYNASLVRSLLILVNGWPLTNVWTGPPVGPSVPGPLECDGVLMSTGEVLTGVSCSLNGTIWYSGAPPAESAIWDVTVSFNPTRYRSGGTWIYYQDLTYWRFTVDLKTMPGSAQYFNSLPNGFYLYKNGNNTALAPGEDCSDPRSITFQEETASSSPTTGFIVSQHPLPNTPASNLLCQGPAN